MPYRTRHHLPLVVHLQWPFPRVGDSGRWCSNVGKCTRRLIVSYPEGTLRELAEAQVPQATAAFLRLALIPEVIGSAWLCGGDALLLVQFLPVVLAETCALVPISFLFHSSRFGPL